MINQYVLSYLIDFLIGPVYPIESDTITSERLSFAKRVVRPGALIRYTDRSEEMIGAHVVIKPSSFFRLNVYGTPAAEPTLPLAEWEGIPILFGEPRTEWICEGQTLLIHADLIASTYYLISRYEEMSHRGSRDAYGRFLGQDSLPYRAGFIHRPIVDEYGVALRQLIQDHGIAERAGVTLSPRLTTFSQITLSHGMDRPYHYGGISGWIRAVFADHVSPLRAFSLAFGSTTKDARTTVPRFLAWNAKLSEELPEGLVRTLLFLGVPSTYRVLPQSWHTAYARSLRHLKRLGERAQVQYGLYLNRDACTDPRLAVHQREFLQHYFTHRIKRSRHQMLAFGEPEDSLELLGSGIRYDYSMGFYDVAGFRLGTCRPVYFINPNTRALTELIQHPITIVDYALSKGMGLTHEEAEAYAVELVHTVARYGGELQLAWSSERFHAEAHPWHTSLYRTLLHTIKEIVLSSVREESPEDLLYHHVVAQTGCTEV